MSAERLNAPTSPLSLEDACNGFTGFEILGIQQHFGEKLENLGGAMTMYAAVWAYENRRERVAWPVVMAMSMQQVHDYFADEDPDPESEQGKGPTSAERTPGG